MHATKTKIAWQLQHSFGPFQFYTRKNLYPRCFSPVAYTPRKVIRHTTSDFWRLWNWPGYANELSTRCAIWSNYLPECSKTEERNLKKLSQSFVPKCSNTEERKLKKLSQSFVPKCSDKEESNLQEAVFCTKVFRYRGKESPRSCHSLLYQNVQT